MIERNNEDAIKYIDIVLDNDQRIDANKRKQHLITDLLNKSEFLINAGKVDEALVLVNRIEKMVGNDTVYYPQMYCNKSRIMEAKGLHEYAYEYANLVEETTSKIYVDGDNLLTALRIQMNIDSLNQNLDAYIAHRNAYENLIIEQNGDKMNLRMELQSTQNRMELAELNHIHQYQLYMLWAVIVFCAFLIITIIIISKYQNTKKQKQLIQLECDKLDAECFKRKLECELYSRKMMARDEEMKKINQDLLDLSYKLATVKPSTLSGNEKAVKDHLTRLRDKVQTDHPDFSKRLGDQFPDITKTELILAELIKLNLNTDEITSVLNISKAGLIKSRYRLRKRLGVASSNELDSYIISY